MLGQFVDEYTVNCVDVFAMPQSGTGVSVEAVDPVFQTNMLEMLKQTGRPEMVVGWYHSHPGFGCWMSGVDINTQQVSLRVVVCAPPFVPARCSRGPTLPSPANVLYAGIYTELRAAKPTCGGGGDRSDPECEGESGD